MPHRIEFTQEAPAPRNLPTWRLRVGELRVYYDITDVPPVVVIKAIGIKERSRLVIGGEEIELS